ncbi:GFA family protein [Emcibacter sp. SYSU 3D8]|uniref:GFA family protein n=1 Tax=Emcibacter sp. SYSU 3D8 TaxID=3133969 RepID=UPI0031FE4B74
MECQKRTGSTYGIAAFFSVENVDLVGKAQCYTRSSDTGFDVSFYFCPACGSTVYWKPSRMPALVAVAVGAFADPTFPEPDQSVYSEYRHHWVLTC